MNRRLRALVASIGLATASVVGAGVPGPAEAFVPELGTCRADAEMWIGSMGDSVSCLQMTLGLMGIYHGRVNGIYDQITADSVRYVQLAAGDMLVDGKADAETLDLLGIYSGVDYPAPPPLCAAAATVSPGEDGPDVECLQSTLRDIGMFIGEVDGNYGQDTADAVARYQLNNPPLEPDGVAGSRTLAALGIWNGKNENTVFVPGSPGTPGTPAGPGPWPAPMKPLPEYNLTAEGIPVYGNRGACTMAQADVVAAEFAQDGADVDTQQWAVYVASREGGCDHTVINYNMATRDDSHCTFQLNVLSGTFESYGELGRHGWTPESVRSSLEACADAASDLWVYCGRGPWTPPYYCRPPWQGGLPNGGD